MRILDKIIKVLERKGFTDTVDVDTAVSLCEYGIARNPKTGLVIYAFQKENGTFAFDWTRADIDDVKEALSEMREGFWSFIGSSLENELSGLNNDYLSSIIMSMNNWNGYFQQSCTWDMNAKDVLAFIMSKDD